MKKKNKRHPILLQEKPWANNENKIWLASTFSLNRNLEKFHFPSKLSTQNKRQIISLVHQEIQQSSELQDPHLLTAEEITPTEKEFLMEHFLTNQSYQHAHGGEAFIVDETGELFVLLNLQDHIETHLIDAKGDLENSWNRLARIETDLGKKMNYSYSERFGFMTSDFTRCGTAFNLTIFLQMSGLIHLGQIDAILDKYSDDKVVMTGMQGNPTEIIGDIVAITNNYTLGVTEENVISHLRAVATKLMVEENSTRSLIRNEEIASIKDKVSRAYAILTHSYQIEAVEALNAISLLKLGTDLGWVKGVAIVDLNHLFFSCRRAHLLLKEKKEVEQEAILHLRAEFIHKTLKGVKLTI